MDMYQDKMEGRKPKKTPMNKEGTFLKKLCCGVGESVYQGKLVLSIEFKTKIGHRKELKG